MTLDGIEMVMVGVKVYPIWTSNNRLENKLYYEIGRNSVARIVLFLYGVIINMRFQLICSF